MNFVPCLAWVKRGVAKATPEKVRLLKEELKELVEADDGTVEDNVANSDTDEHMKGDAGDIDAKYDLDKYDDETDAPSNANQLAGLAMYASNADDPYMSGKSDEESEEEIDDFTIRQSDNLIAVARVDDDCGSIEIYVSNEAEDHLYVHHDIIVQTYPVCIEWLSYDPTESSPGNYIAVGDMTPVISVWDLDVVDSLEPAYKLGKKTKKKAHKPSDGHTDAVISLSWNRQARQVLASGSADHKVITWDLSAGVPNIHITGHNEKVQSIQWHPFEASTLLTGSSDHTVKLWDCRAIDAGCKSWSVGSEVEKVLWNHFDPFYFYVSTEEGHVYGFDARSDSAVFTLSAHTQAVTGMALSTHCPGCLITASADKLLKVWDIQDEKPVFVLETDAKVGSVLALASSPDEPFLLAAGGDNHSHSFRVINLKAFNQMNRFENRRLVQPVEVPSEGHMETDSTVGALGDLSLAGPSKNDT
ncbi:periodic tryptophan protein 1 homolog [Ornithodoros turicata]|uniref:periodic tryptophan protein 1 homolog n=1 Tax=Ornithodoros turicata TaxID=34597 RepID=UPI003138E269